MFPIHNQSFPAATDTAFPVTTEGLSAQSDILNQSVPSRHIAFVDSGLADLETLIAGLEHTQVFLLDSNQNGIEQITATLSGQANLESIHIFSHGQAGGLQLGDTLLSGGLLSEYSEQLSSWHDALSQTADLMLYGCNVAANEEGQAFLAQLSDIVGADVAASNDVTGLGGDWQLEAMVGEIEADIALIASNQASYSGTLALLNNGDFESGLSGWNGFTGSEQTISAVAFSGTQSLELTAAGSGVGSDLIPVSTEGRYRLTANVQSTTTGYAGFGINLFDENFEVIDSAGQSVNVSGDWTSYEVEATVGADVSYVQVWTYKDQGDGAVFFDTFNLSTDAVAPPPPPSGTELLQNPDFEAGLSNWSAFVGSESVSNSESFSGASSLRLSDEGSGVSQFLNTVVPGQSYTLSGYSKTSSNDYVGLGVNFYDADFNVLGGNAGRQVTSPDWQRYEVTVTAPEQAQYLQLWTYKNDGSGEAFFDDLSLITGTTPPPPPTDTTPPTATLNATEVTTAANQYEFTVTYQDDSELDVSSLDNDDIVVTGPNGFSQAASFVSVDQTGDGTPRTATYRITPPNSNWAEADNGSYTIALQTNQVSDTVGNLASGATLGNFEVNIPAPPDPGEFSFEVSTVTVDEGSASIDLTVNRIGSTAGVASVDYQTFSQTAVALEDFIPVEGTLTFGDGEAFMTIRIPIINDGNVEEDETFAVQLSNPTNGATLGTQRTVVAIDDNDQIAGAGTLTFTGPMAMVSEANGLASIKVARVGGSNGTVTVDYTTSNDGAIAGQDYTAASGTLTFEDGVTEQVITVPIINDTTTEPRETFFLEINNPVGGAVIGTESIMVAINDDDIAPPPPPADPEYRYVRFVANSEVNGNPWTSLAELNLLDGNDNLISQANWTLESVNSEELVVSNRPATDAFDGNPNTFWHTEWAPPGNDNDPRHPHEIVIDLEAEYNISGFSYLPRQDASQNGQVADYAFYVSNNGIDWGSPVAVGLLQNIKSEQIIRFEDFNPGNLIPGLVGHWKLNETVASSPVLDSSGISSNGTANNFTGINGPYNAAPIFDGDNPRSWDFDGVDDHITIASDADLDLSDGAFTQSVWINSDSTDNAYHGILGKQNAGGVVNRYPGIWVYQQNRIHAGFGDGTNWSNFTTGNVLKPNAWNHVVTSFDGTTYKAFVNGDEVFSTDDFAGRKPVALDTFDIGRVDNYFDGQIDDVRIYNRGLSDSEIQSLYQVQPDAAQVGSWSEVIEFPNIPVSAASLPNGKIVTWSSWDRFQFAGNRFDRTYTSLFDTRTQEVGEFLVTNTNHDMFCPGTVMLPDGRVLVNGGGGDTKFTSVYDFTTNSWSVVDSMEYGRWYNVSVTLGDGSVFTLGGNRSNARRGPGELWTEDTGWTTLSGTPIDPISAAGNRGDEHPQLFAAPNGKVFIAGPSSTMYWYDVTGNGSYTEAGLRGDDPYSQNGLTVMYDEGKLLRAGGQSVYSGGNVTDVAYDIDINNGDQVTVDKQDPMSYRRSYATGVVMADGQVFVVGGSEKGVAFSDAEAVYRPEIWNPDTGEWTLLAQQQIARTYHSVALLQPDGRVFVGGGGLCGNCSTNHSDAEIYTPAYLYNEDGTLADRPVIGSGPDQAGYGQNIDITIDNGMPITEFNLVRLSSVTHSVNTDQRFLSVDFTANGDGSYELTAPENGNVAPPGYYMLFAMNDQGVPSEAKMIQIG